MNKYRIVLYILCVALGLAILVLGGMTPRQPQQIFDPNVIENSEIGKEVRVKRIRVISGHEYEVAPEMRPLQISALIHHLHR